ncbi:unnamed protein product [Bursaphelenchus okinawaensis]|uniref:Uncharacterized protein n=1 Tax=Bursaphelenchus okinawaensis TaxID=465554 RepID=A0A811LIU9_9BILA|nr:unnamed protein product [Bursaphelenchus okinawaensis]CAG9123185.1 unnamed protein product [Bursaphelenchus okinawaensis]
MGDLALIDILAKVLGRRLVIELSNDTTVDGILLSTLPNCFRLGNSKVYTQSDRSPVCCVNCFVEKKRVRFIHFPQDIHLYNIQKKLMECPV